MNLFDYDLHSARPIVYLDQWVWVRLARAYWGRPKEKVDLDLLSAVCSAGAAGVAFPLSATHYQEVSATANERQRKEIAQAMASISFCRTLRSRHDLLRHQMLTAMHFQLGRPAFRPSPPEVLGVGMKWALVGQLYRLGLNKSGQSMQIPDGMTGFVRRAHQGAEQRFLEGARASEIADLRRYGYKPEVHQTTVRSRLEWEELYADLLLREDRIDRQELRVRVQARELIHEHLDLFVQLLSEYGLEFRRVFRADSDLPGSGRAQLIAFADAIPSFRIAADLKTELFRDTGKAWDRNSLYDVDALSMAVPYCDAVVADKHMANLLARSHAGERSNTRIVTRLADLPELLASMSIRAQEIGGDATGWNRLYPGYGWDPLDIDGLGAGDRIDS